MAPVVVKENIDRIKSSISDIKKQNEELQKTIDFNKEELLRLEGCLVVFNGFSDAGITVIKNDQENNEQQKPPQEVEQPHIHQVCEQKECEQKECDQNPKDLTEIYKKYSVM